MDYTQVKLIASDMDGTLLPPTGELDPGFFSLFSRLSSRNVHFIAASGRQYHNLVKKFHPIRNEMTFIAENGAYVVHRGEELSVTDLSPDQAARLIAAVRKLKDAYPVLCGKNSAYVENRQPDFLTQVGKYYERLEVVDDLMKVTDDRFLKIAVYDFKNAGTNAYSTLKTFGQELRVVVSGEYWLDISQQGVDKGKALSLIQDKLALSPSQTMVFGDQMNDVEMMEQAYYSFAVDNAVDKVKAVSRFRAPANTENGVISIMEQVATATEN